MFMLTIFLTYSVGYFLVKVVGLIVVWANLWYKARAG